MEASGSGHFREELYFLITKFLEAGPCKEAVKTLKKELSEHKIIPYRLDWEGNRHEQSFDELEKKYPHISPEHLLEICKRIGPILEKEIKPCAPGVKTLLGAGRQSLLRNSKDDKTHLRLSEFIARRHGASLHSPITCHHHNIVQVLFGRETSGPPSRKHLISSRMYTRTHLLNRTLGHLSAVYCLLFDHTGRYIITGADDLLVKIWSALDGRLLYTLRGAAAEITDIAINLENTLLAAGSLDKVIRVWCLQTAYPVATLSAHTGMITGVNFCPNPFNDIHYLVSTSTDGSVAFWSYVFTSCNDPVIFQTKPVLYHEKMRPGQAQMICSSFSPGGAFLAAGSADHHVRVYCMKGDSPYRVMEMEQHSDRVDSILWSNKGLKFISGSKDGTAVLWQYRAQTWHTRQLHMTTTLPGKVSKEDDPRLKLKVTMVCWSTDDTFVITAVNNNAIKVWSPVNGKLLKELNAHRDVVYCLENHPLDSRIMLSAGHDGIIYIWDLLTGEQLFMHQNHIEGQGNGAVFDAKWSPDGSMMASTDSHGHLLIFSLSEFNDKMKLLPKELFFHTDYRPLVRDAQNQVLDEQTQTPPHLMPPPFLVDVDGTPYPPNLQRLVPGRENLSTDQLIPNIIISPGGQAEVIQPVGEVRSNIDQRIEELAHSNHVQNSHESSLPINELSPRSRLLRRGDIEGVRQSTGDWQLDGFKFKNQKYIVNQLSRGMLYSLKAEMKFIGTLELDEYERESKKVAEFIPEIPITLPNKKPNKRRNHSYRTRATRDVPISTSQDGEEESESAPTDGNSSDGTAISEQIGSSTSDSSSTEYSDWVADHSVNLEPPQRNRRQRKRKPPQPASKPVPPAVKKSLPDSNQEIPELYRPSEWLAEVIPKKFPYYPQMGDEVMFFAQGYELYIKAVQDRKVYELAKSQLRPWGNIQLKEPELVKVIGIKYELRPPRLCCLRLAVMKENGRLAGDRFTIKYHDIPDVIDFFVLKQTYDVAMARNWKIGDRFRSMIDDGWWWGSIEARRPNSNSPFLCHRIRWDNGETEDMSPWDMEPVDQNREPDHGGSVPVLPEEIAAILYHPRGDEWPGGDRDASCRTTIAGLEEVMGLSIAEPFLAPVDINIYKSYAYIVEFPIDLSTIKARFESRFYRRLTAAQFDIRYLATNAEKFNESHSIIVKHARIVTDLCLRICKEIGYVDVPQLYRQLLDGYESSNSEDENGGPSTSRRERAAANRSLRALRRANHQQPDWKRDCRQLLEVLWNCQDSEPFRGPVDRIEHPDYDKIIDSPMDLGTVREELIGENYSSPIEFCKDIRMIFSNSRSYNTNKRSKVYVMTVRLAAMAEEHMKRIINDWKASCRKQNKNIKLNGMRKRRMVKYSDDCEHSNDNSSSGSEHSSVKSNKGKYQTRSRNNIKIKNISEDDDISDNESRVVRPLRLKVNNLKKFNSGSWSDRDTPSSSSASQRQLRRIKDISYAENENESSSISSSSSSEENNHSLSQETDHVEKGDPTLKWTLNGHVRVIKPLKVAPPTNNESDSEDVNIENGIEVEEFSEEIVEEESESGPYLGTNVETESDDCDNSNFNPVGVTFSHNSFINNNTNNNGISHDSETTSSEGYHESKQDSDDNYDIDEQDDQTDEESNHSTRGHKRKKSSGTDSSETYNPRLSKIVTPSRRSMRARKPVKRPNYVTDSDSDSKSQTSCLNNRPMRSVMRKHYRESVESSGDSSHEKPKISISSRGRVRKITARARAFLRD